MRLASARERFFWSCGSLVRISSNLYVRDQLRYVETTSAAHLGQVSGHFGPEGIVDKVSAILYVRAGMDLEVSYAGTSIRFLFDCAMVSGGYIPMLSETFPGQPAEYQTL